ncbi:hypothetical protein RHMOL_Rhmol08G0033700 [Rhododendron molle]|uniref:Uncharacterized protein n=1 Tax=Rhododendron molle TaxID=49168 RepID=A0ACC0MJ31_RHOML|nr:hypothetical protein RHMOL_Rhmol08G0033700 [Rhododendron molle]
MKDKAVAVQVSQGMLLEAEEMAYRIGEKEAEDMVTLMHAASCFDLSNSSYSNLQGQASSSSFTHDELNMVGQFGLCSTPKQENSINSIEENIQDFVTHVKEWMTMSGADIPGTQSTYNAGLETLMNMFGGLGTGTPSHALNVPAEELYATQLLNLQEMGFMDPQENMQALIATTGNVHAAVERLLGNLGQ